MISNPSLVVAPVRRTTQTVNGITASGVGTGLRTNNEAPIQTVAADASSVPPPPTDTTTTQTTLPTNTVPTTTTPFDPNNADYFGQYAGKISGVPNQPGVYTAVGLPGTFTGELDPGSPSGWDFTYNGPSGSYTGMNLVAAVGNYLGQVTGNQVQTPTNPDAPTTTTPSPTDPDAPTTTTPSPTDPLAAFTALASLLGAGSNSTSGQVAPVQPPTIAGGTTSTTGATGSGSMTPLILVGLGIAGGVWYFTRKKKAAEPPEPKAA